MIIQKGTTKAIFNTHGLQLSPDALPAIDRQVRIIIERFAERASNAGGRKRLQAGEIWLAHDPQILATARSGVEAHEDTTSRKETNPSKIPGPCSRCVGLPAGVMRIARNIGTQISGEAVALYHKELKGTR